MGDVFNLSPDSSTNQALSTPSELLSPFRESPGARSTFFCEALHLTGNWAGWATDSPSACLEVVPGSPEGFVRLKLCVKLTSPTLSFQVVSARRGWTWRLYPRNATRHTLSEEGL